MPSEHLGRTTGSRDDVLIHNRKAICQFLSCKKQSLYLGHYQQQSARRCALRFLGRAATQAGLQEAKHDVAPTSHRGGRSRERRYAFTSQSGEVDRIKHLRKKRDLHR